MKKISILLTIFILFTTLMPAVAYAAPNDGGFNNPNDINVTIGDKGLEISGGGFTKSKADAWATFISQYRYLITGIAGMGAVTMIGLFIFSFLKLGASVGNPQARSQALSGCLWTGVSAMGLGAVTLITGFFYSAIGGS